MKPNLPTPPVHTAHTRTPNTQPPARALTLCARVGYYTAAVLLQPVSWSICACPPPSGPSSRARPSAPRHSARLRHTLVSGVCHAAVACHPFRTPSAHARHAAACATPQCARPLFRFTTVKLSGVLQYLG